MKAKDVEKYDVFEKWLVHLIEGKYYVSAFLSIPKRSEDWAEKNLDQLHYAANYFYKGEGTKLKKALEARITALQIKAKNAPENEAKRIEQEVIVIKKRLADIERNPLAGFEHYIITTARGSGRQRTIAALVRQVEELMRIEKSATIIDPVHVKNCYMWQTFLLKTILDAQWKATFWGSAITHIGRVMRKLGIKK